MGFKSLLLNRLKFLKVEELDLNNQAIREFENLYERYIAEGKGDEIPYESSYPKYLFLNYLIENKNSLVHGSNNLDIEVFEPRPSTLFNGKPVTAVFASTDGIWSMFFATLKRKGYKGSIRNGCFTARTKKGLKRYYYFSINKDYKNDSWVNGMIYILPKSSFKNSAGNEWICETEVCPLAKIPIKQEDFIFQKAVRYHDERESNFTTVMKILFLGK